MSRHFNEIHELWCSKTAKSVLLVKEGIDREKNLSNIHMYIHMAII